MLDDDAARLSPPVTDVLGEPWVQRRISLRPTPEDPRPEAVLVQQREPTQGRRAVLYLHGFSDYFFQTGHAERWAAAGFDFYALDLRLSGRAIGDRPRPGDVRDLRRHDEEIAVALAAIRAEGHDQVVLIGHSTGGLIAVGWADRHPGSVDAVVLNSPWFDHNGPWVERVLLTRLVRLLARWLPSVVVGYLDEPYGRYLRAAGWNYDLAWKPRRGFPMRAGTFASVRAEQARLRRGLDVPAPVLLCCSTRSGAPASPTEQELHAADCVLDVRHMVARAPLVGPDVTIVEIDGGTHDLALSPEPAREAYEQAATEWATARLSPPHRERTS